jgi:hypothetical protein
MNSTETTRATLANLPADPEAAARVADIAQQAAKFWQGLAEHMRAAANFYEQHRPELDGIFSAMSREADSLTGHAVAITIWADEIQQGANVITQLAEIQAQEQKPDSE